jgi:hypothetical protein
MSDDFRPSATGGTDKIEHAGESIVRLIREAANVASSQAKQALDVAHKLSLQLRDAQARIAELEDAVSRAQDRARKAEEWMVKISSEIENQFLEQVTTPKQAGQQRRSNGNSQPQSFAPKVVRN